jgi:hypothetical protein
VLSLTTRIIQYENGELDEDEVQDLFSELLDSGLIYQLQGSYQRTAQALLDAGYIRPASPRGGSMEVL